MSEPSDKPNPSPHWLDPIIDAYKKDVDRTLIRENLKLTPDQRLMRLEALLADAEEFRRAMNASKARDIGGANDSIS
jgi:hypothetical protein